MQWSDGEALGLASEELKADAAVVMAAVQQDGWALAYASERLKADVAVVMAAVQQEGRALMHASEDVRALIRCRFHRHTNAKAPNQAQGAAASPDPLQMHFHHTLQVIPRDQVPTLLSLSRATDKRHRKAHMA